MRFRDEDDGASTIDVVAVPEGISIQLADIYHDDGDFISVILKPDSIDELITFLQEYRFGEKK